MYNDFNYKGLKYDLKHLNQFTATYKQPPDQNNADSKEITYTVNVTFSTHCFTKGLINSTGVDPNLLYSGFNEKRIFDFERYELSKSLKNIIIGLDKRKISNTGKGNFLTIEVIDSNGQKKDYEVYFKVSKSTQLNRLNLYVESAYIRDDLHKLGNRKIKRIGFYVIAHKTLRGEQITLPP